MWFELSMALRYLGGLRRAQPFVSVIAAISVLGIALGVAALLVVLGIMTGFDADLEDKIVGFNPHLVVQTQEPILDEEAILKQITDLPEVEAAAPFLQTQVLLKSRKEATGVILRGIDPEREIGVTRLAHVVQEGSWPPQEKELFLGSELARRWTIRKGDSIEVIGVGSIKPIPMVVGGIFTTGMYEYDAHLAVTTRQTVRDLLGKEIPISGIGVRVAQPMQAHEIKQTLQRTLGYPFWVVSWMDLNSNLFAALKLEKVAMFVILTLIILVACFNIVATLLMMVVGKIKEVGILKAVGATNLSVRRIFSWAGLIIGFLGTTLGVVLGLALCSALAKYQFIQLPPEIYYIDRLPVKLEWKDGFSVAVAALVISWVSTLYPAWVASRLQPAEAIRYE